MLTVAFQQLLWENFFSGGNLRVGLSLTEPTVGGQNVTPPGGNYAPVDVPAGDFTIVEVGVPLTDVYVKNDDFIGFVESGPTIPWGTIPYWTIEAFVGSWMLFEYGLITDRVTGDPSPAVIGTEDVFTFDPDKLILTFDN